MATTSSKKTSRKAAPKAAAKSTKKTAPKAAAKSAGKNEEFAVIETGGKQYMVAVGDTLLVERLPGELTEGDTIEFEKVLMVDDGKDATIGTPYIQGAKVSATYQGEAKGKKLNIIRFESKSNRDRNVGHRQKYSRVTIDALS